MRQQERIEIDATRYRARATVRAHFRSITRKVKHTAMSWPPPNMVKLKAYMDIERIKRGDYPETRQEAISNLGLADLWSGYEVAAKPIYASAR